MEKINDPIRIILVDDHKLVRESWKMLLQSNPAFRVIGDFDNGPEAIEYTRELIPDILLVDINMSPYNGFELTEKITQMCPTVKIIGLSVNNQPRYATRLIELGAKGYLTKTSSLEEIHQGIIKVYNNEIYICEEIKNQLS